VITSGDSDPRPGISPSLSETAPFPECLEDWICEDNPVRVIDAFVEELDLAELKFGGVDPEATGRPAYHPSVMLKLYIYGYLNRVQSSRRLERESGRNVEVMWLTGRLVPDHKTIADFRKDNGPAIRKVCVRFVALCRQMGLLTQASVRPSIIEASHKTTPSTFRTEPRPAL
jgi:transposase